MQAMRVFGFTDASSLNESNIQRQYRVMMKRFHPDVCGENSSAHTMGEAYDVLKTFVKENESFNNDRHSQKYIIDFDDYLSILDGQSFKLCNEDRVIKISLDNISDYDLLLMIKLSIDVGGVEYSFDKLCTKDPINKYSICCTLNCNQKSELNMIIRSANKRLSLCMVGNYLDVMLNYKHGCKLTVHIERKQVNG